MIYNATEVEYTISIQACPLTRVNFSFSEVTLQQEGKIEHIYHHPWKSQQTLQFLDAYLHTRKVDGTAPVNKTRYNKQNGLHFQIVNGYCRAADLNIEVEKY